jgi:hypothetical protein
MFERFVENETLDQQDAFLLDSVLTAVFVARQNEYFQWKQGLLDDEVFTSLHHVILALLGSPNGEHWWQNEGHRMFAPAFIEFVNNLRQTGPTDSYQAWKRAIRAGDDHAD